MGKTLMQKRYLIKFLIRLVIFIGIFTMYIVDKDFLYQFITHKFTFGISEYGINILHVLWFVFMVMMLSHLFPRGVVTMALGKAKPQLYVEEKGYSHYELLKYVQDMNRNCKDKTCKMKKRLAGVVKNGK